MNNSTNSTTHSGIMTLKDLRDAIEKIKKLDPVTMIKTGSLKPIKNSIPSTDGNIVGSIYGIRVIIDEDLQPDEYKIVHQSGKEELKQW